MFDVIKRVISGDDIRMESTSSPAATKDDDGISQPPQQQTAQQHDKDLPTSSVEIRPVALIENDMDIDVTTGNAANTPGSSLSDMSAARRELELETIDESIKQQQALHHSYQRTDSKMSSDSSSGSMKANSQSSSRDWGWFEDVYASEINAPSSSKRKENSKKKGKNGRGLVPQPETTSSGGLEGMLLHHKPPTPTDAAAMAVTAPTYVLEESLSNQKLWKHTAGNRPPQPLEERAFFEKMWAQNFARSQVEYRIPVEVLTATTPISMSPFADGTFDTARETDLSNYNIPSNKNNHMPAGGDAAERTLISRLNDQANEQTDSSNLNKKVKGSGSEGDVTVLVKGDNVFGTTVSKSFARSSERGGPVVEVDTVNISIASYRVVESKKLGKYAQFLVIYRDGSIRDTIGVWKRYSDFQELSKKVTQAHEGCAAVIANMSPLSVTEEHEVEHLPNAITSWHLLKKRQRWYRCLDAGYLSLKVFLLERFLHDILFESSSPYLLREFIANGRVLELTE